MRDVAILIGGVLSLLVAGFIAWSGLLPPFVLTNTTYAHGYSETRFKAIKLGAPEKEVRTALGIPLAEFTTHDGRTTMIYSFRKRGFPIFYYRSRVIILSNSVVNGKASVIND